MAIEPPMPDEKWPYCPKNNFGNCRAKRDSHVDACLKSKREEEREDRGQHKVSSE